MNNMGTMLRDGMYTFNGSDLLLLDGNPLSDISQTQRIRAVVLDGRLLLRADLDRLLKAATA